jgi:hypothetical protein
MLLVSAGLNFIQNQRIKFVVACATSRVGEFVDVLMPLGSP